MNEWLKRYYGPDDQSGAGVPAQPSAAAPADAGRTGTEPGTPEIIPSQKPASAPAKQDDAKVDVGQVLKNMSAKGSKPAQNVSVGNQGNSEVERLKAEVQFHREAFNRERSAKDRALNENNLLKQRISQSLPVNQIPQPRVPDAMDEFLDGNPLNNPNGLVGIDAKKVMDALNNMQSYIEKSEAEKRQEAQAATLNRYKGEAFQSAPFFQDPYMGEILDAVTGYFSGHKAPEEAVSNFWQAVNVPGTGALTAKKLQQGIESAIVNNILEGRVGETMLGFLEDYAETVKESAKIKPITPAPHPGTVPAKGNVPGSQEHPSEDGFKHVKTAQVAKKTREQNINDVMYQGLKETLDTAEQIVQDHGGKIMYRPPKVGGGG